MAMMTRDTSELGARAERPEQLLYTLDDVALALRISRPEVERAVARATLASVKIGRLRRITWRQLEAYITRLESGEVA